jgi:hypothetical protein
MPMIEWVLDRQVNRMRLLNEPLKTIEKGDPTMMTEEQAQAEDVTQDAVPTTGELVAGLDKRDEPKTTLTLRDRFLAWLTGVDAPDAAAPALPPGTVSARVNA